MGNNERGERERKREATQDESKALNLVGNENCESEMHIKMRIFDAYLDFFNC